MAITQEELQRYLAEIKAQTVGDAKEANAMEGIHTALHSMMESEKPAEKLPDSLTLDELKEMVEATKTEAAETKYPQTNGGTLFKNKIKDFRENAAAAKKTAENPPAADAVAEPRVKDSPEGAAFPSGIIDGVASQAATNGIENTNEYLLGPLTHIKLRLVGNRISKGDSGESEINNAINLGIGSATVQYRHQYDTAKIHTLDQFIKVVQTFTDEQRKVDFTDKTPEQITEATRTAFAKLLTGKTLEALEAEAATLPLRGEAILAALKTKLTNKNIQVNLDHPIVQKDFFSPTEAFSVPRDAIDKIVTAIGIERDTAAEKGTEHPLGKEGAVAMALMKGVMDNASFDDNLIITGPEYFNLFKTGLLNTIKEKPSNYPMGQGDYAKLTKASDIEPVSPEFSLAVEAVFDNLGKGNSEFYKTKIQESLAAYAAKNTPAPKKDKFAFVPGTIKNNLGVVGTILTAVGLGFLLTSKEEGEQKEGGPAPENKRSTWKVMAGALAIAAAAGGFYWRYKMAAAGAAKGDPSKGGVGT